MRDVDEIYTSKQNKIRNIRKQLLIEIIILEEQELQNSDENRKQTINTSNQFSKIFSDALVNHEPDEIRELACIC